MRRTETRKLNDQTPYETPEDGWWDPRGRFAMLQWIAAARSTHIPPASRDGAVLVDVACGAGLLATHTRGLGYQHIGIDLSRTALTWARRRSVHVLQGDARKLPLPDEVADVVVAGEILEHVREHEQVVAEACRVLRAGGTLILDTLADTQWARVLSITIGERVPGGPPARLHDPAMYVNRENLVRVAAEHGVRLQLHGLRPSITEYVQWLRQHRETVRMVQSRSTAGLFQAVGTKERE